MQMLDGGNQPVTWVGFSLRAGGGARGRLKNLQGMHMCSFTGHYKYDIGIIISLN